MSVIIGSARTSHTSQDGQVSVQGYYNPKSGFWYGFEPKNSGSKLSKAMLQACNNNYIGYSMPNREEAWNSYRTSIKDINVYCHTDCSALVRLCIRQAFGVSLPNFYTGNQRAVLNNSGLFKPPIKVTNENQCTTGMILLSEINTHTVIVITANKSSNSSKLELPSCQPMLRMGSKGQEVAKLQQCLNIAMSSHLVVDGDFGNNTDNILRAFQLSHNLEVDGIYGTKSQAKLKNKLGL